jgi:rhodanese-related sulfurtransferase
MADVRTLSTDEMAKLTQENGAQVWNVLTPDYFSGEMIPGSRHVPLDRLEQHLVQARVPKSARIIVYCSGAPSCLQSNVSAQKLTELGYVDVADYEGGLTAWKAAGRPVEHATKVLPA